MFIQLDDIVGERAFSKWDIIHYAQEKHWDQMLCQDVVDLSITWNGRKLEGNPFTKNSLQKGKMQHCNQIWSTLYSLVPKEELFEWPNKEFSFCFSGKELS